MGRSAEPVVLNTTLAELYHHDGLDNVVLCPQPLFVLCDSSNHMAPKYRYHDFVVAWPKSRALKEPEKKEKELRERATSYMCKGQRNAFIAGGMKVVLFDIPTKINSNDGRRDTEMTMDALCSEQKPQLAFLSSFDDLVLDQCKSEKLAVLLPVNEVEKQPQVISPELLWELLSKRGLALSGLPTPKADLVELDINEANSEHQYKQRALQQLGHRPLPYVVKLQGTLSGHGTFVVSSEEDRSQVVKSFRSAILPNLLDMITPENRHMRPESLVFTDYVESKESRGISFFVKRSGEAIFISGSVQKFNNEHHYDGSTIDFAAQDGFREEYTDLVNEVASFLHKKGYYGPVGMDLLKDVKTGKSYVVDLNVRIPGSIFIGLLSNYFTKCGFNWACMEEDLKLPFNREQFLKTMQREIVEGRLIIVCWLDHWETGGALGSFILGAETEHRLKKFLADLKALGK